MSTSPDAKFHTDLVGYLLDLLDFVEEKFKDVQNNRALRNSALSEAMGAFPIVKDRLKREDQVMLTQFLLIGFFDEDLTQLMALPEDELARKVDDLHQRHMVVRNILGHRVASTA